MDSEETTDASEQWRMERYRALARRAEQSAEAVWTNARVLIPLAAALFAPLVWIECPDEYDLLVLSGPSLLLVALWAVLAEGCLLRKRRLERSVAEVEQRAGLTPAISEGGQAAARLGRWALAAAFAGLWLAAWQYRRPCEEAPPPMNQTRALPALESAIHSPA